MTWPRVTESIFASGAQAAWSVANVTLTLSIARSCSLSEFATFSIFFSAVVVVVPVVRGFVGLPLLGSGAATDAGQVKLELERAMGFTASASILIGFGYGFAFALNASPAWAVFALSVPLLALNEVQRCVAARRAQSRVVLAGDLLRLVLHASLFAATFLIQLSLLQILCWLVVGASVDVALVTWALKVRWRLRGLLGWLQQDMGGRISGLIDLGVPSLSGAVYVALLGFGLPAHEVAGLRGATVLLAPMGVAFAALPLVLLPRLRRGDGGVATLWRYAALLSSGCLAIGSIGMWLPSGTGRGILGDVWGAASGLLPLVSIDYAFQATRAVFANQLRIQGRHGLIATVRLGQLVLMLAVTGVLLAAGGGAVEVAVGVMLVSGVVTVAVLAGLRGPT